MTIPQPDEEKLSQIVLKNRFWEKGNKGKKPPVYSNRAIIRRIRRLTGLSYRQAKDCLHAFSRAMGEMLLEGQELTLWDFGKFQLRHRPGRKTAFNTFVPDRMYVKFHPSLYFRSKLKELKPWVPESQRKARLRNDKNDLRRLEKWDPNKRHDPPQPPNPSPAS